MNLEEPDERVNLTTVLSALASEEDGREYLRANSHLRTREVVDQLTNDVVRLVRVDMRPAERLASITLWLADELEDDYCRGRSQRAAANVSHFKGEHREASILYEVALESFERSGDDKEAAVTRSSALQNLVFLGKYKRAFAWASHARKTFEEIGDHLRLARLELNVGNILFRQDRWEEAADRYAEAYEEFRRFGEPQDVAVALRNMAVCHSSLNNFEQSLEFYQKARAFCEEHQLPVFVVEIDYNIAYLYFLRGEYTTAIELYQSAREKCEQVGERYHMALCDLDQAEIFLELNLIEEASDLASKGYAGFEELGIPYEAAKTLVILAIAVSREGKTFLALELFDQARETFTDEENMVWPALIDLYKGLVMYKAGRPLEAERLARSALQDFSGSSLANKTAMCEVLLARLLLDKNQYSAAQDVCGSALRRLRAQDLFGLEYQIYYVLGQIAEAEEDRDSALRAYEESEKRLERFRSHLQTEDLKIAFVEDKLLVYESLVSMMLGDVVTTQDKEHVFTFFEKAKSRSLADLVAFRAHAIPPTRATRSDQARQVRKLREELNWYYRQIDLQEMRGGSKSRDEVQQLRTVSRKQEDHLVRSLREFQATDQEFSSLQEANVVSLDMIRSVMPDGTLLVEYYLARDVVYACVLGKNVLEIVPVSVVSRVLELHRLMHFQLSKFSMGAEYVDAFSDAIAESTKTQLRGLYDELIRPIRDCLAGKQLVVVPHGTLHYVPFHALLNGDEYLIDSYDVSFAPSASVFYFSCCKEVSSNSDSLVMGVGAERSPEVRREVEAVAEVLPGSRVLLDAEATADALRSEGSKSRIVYLASRGSYRRDNPMFSAVELGDSRLNLFDLYSLRLEADLVVVSGCGVGHEFAEDRDEIVGLTCGLLYSGARSVLTTLWNSGEENSRLFMRSFLEKLTSGAKKGRALRHAMLEVRKEYPHPYYWAPYILVGDFGVSP